MFDEGIRGISCNIVVAATYIIIEYNGAESNVPTCNNKYAAQLEPIREVEEVKESPSGLRQVSYNMD